MTKLTINGRFLTQPVTGVQRVGIEFCRALDSLLQDGEFPGLQVELVVPRNSELTTELALDQIRVRRHGRLQGHLWEQFELPRAARGSHLLALGNTAPLSTLLFRPSSISVMVHDLSYRYYPDAYTPQFRWLYELLVPFALKRASTVFTVSESERTAILSSYPRLHRPDRLIAVQNGSTFEPQADPPGRSSRRRRCLYVGSLTKRKNAQGLIEAAITLATHHEVEFAFIGSNGPRFEDVGIKIPAELEHRVRFFGQVNDARTLLEEYSRAAVFVFPSFYEASPLPPTEAMACGCPVVTSAIPSLQERCGPAAIYCDPGDVESIVSSVLRVIEDPGLWSQMSAAGVDWSRRYSWTDQARHIVERAIK